MASVQIKHVPMTRTRALPPGCRGAQSLQEYLRAKLIEDASRPTIDELRDRVNARPAGSLSLVDAAKVLHTERTRR